MLQVDAKSESTSEESSLPTAAIEPLSRERLIDCLSTLEKLLLDRGAMALLSEEERKQLVMAAGRFAKPDRFAVTKLRKSFRKQKKFSDMLANRAVIATTAIRQARLADIFEAPALVLPSEQKNADRWLTKPQACYVCKTDYQLLHFFYDSMCPPCAELNYSKRFQSADLRGRVAVITGARVKIGYQAALMLLRAGARVYVTTRFPHDAARRYSRENDFDEWKDRLQIFGLDLRHAPSVELFAKYMVETCDRLDFLLNNAAQTVRRPRGFFAHVVAEEKFDAVSAEARQLLSNYRDCCAKIDQLSLESDANGLISYHNRVGGHSADGIAASAEMSQLVLLPDDLSHGKEVFPEGQYDADLQQVDLRSTNSWRMRLGEVPTAELLEIQLINAIAPFILCSKLKPLMMRHPSLDKHIVNVSAMEGKFSRYTKTDKHPHTNMAKAALNMMTQTSAPDYVKSGIHMNAVDTGWVTDEDPINHATRKREELGFQPPLDIVDGAARICDPIFSGLNSGDHVWGKFLKDYTTSSW